MVLMLDGVAVPAQWPGDHGTYCAGDLGQHPRARGDQALAGDGTQLARVPAHLDRGIAVRCFPPDTTCVINTTHALQSSVRR